MKKVTALLGLEGLLVIAAVVLLSRDDLRQPVAGAAGFYSYAVLAAGLVVGWRFQRSRLLFSVIVLALTHQALTLAAGRATTTGPGQLVFHATALLLPLNLAAIALLPERGILGPAGVRRWTAIAAQVALVVILARAGGPGVGAALQFALLPAKLFGWTSLAQPALVAFGVALALVAGAWFLAPSTTGRGYAWALLAAFLALTTRGPMVDRAVYLATAGLALVVTVIEASYRMAYQDGLTGLPGRRALNEALMRLGGGGQYTVAMVDVDHFKRFNDTYGHDAGDQVLRMVAAKLATVSGGKAYRYGGEEFALLFPGKTVEDCLPELERLRQVVEESTFTLRGRLRPRQKPTRLSGAVKRRKQVSITVSLGAAASNQRSDRPEVVVQAADRALYRAKEAGRNRVET